MLKLSTDRKVATTVRWSKSKRWEPTVKNAFGLTQRASCPYLTPFCGDCYVDGAARYTATQNLLEHNFATLKALGSDVDAMSSELEQMIDEYRATHDKRSPEKKKVFRIHWSGDFFSYQYAVAWSHVVKANPDIAFWAYTRSFNMVDPFAGLPNMAVYLSVDEHNAGWAKKVESTRPWLRLAFCAETWEKGEILAREVTGRNAPKCPELTGRYDLVDVQGDQAQGACVTCGLCIYGRNNVRFSTKN